jgi:predicted secreted hydrolase
MRRFIGLGLVVAGVAIAGFSLIDLGGGDVGADTVLIVPESDTTGFALAIDPRDWSFPRDYGSHPEFQTEWWYYTGNVTDENGRRFGFQFTIFRRGINPFLEDTGSEWRDGQVYMAHFTLSDIANSDFYHSERYSRGGAGLAGALPNPGEPEAGYRVWLEGWEARGLNDDASLQRITAAGDDYAIDLRLEQAKPIVFQGEDGLSAKGDAPGNASYYYSLSRLTTSGTVTVNGETFAVEGATWMDREFSTSALGADAIGWDWFGLHFDDGRDLVVGQIRLRDGGARTTYTGTVVYEDGSSYHLTPEDFTIAAIGEWTSPHTGAVYPAGWEITVSAEAMRQEEDLRFRAIPLQADQELYSGDIAYWEGAVRLEGDATGYGYAELTGYADTLTGRF